MRNRRQLMWLALLSLVVASCGGGDSEERLAEAEQRIEELEEVLGRAPAVGAKVGERSAPPSPQPPAETSSTTFVEPTGRSVSAFSLAVGDCWNESGNPAFDEAFEVLNVFLVPCSEPHDLEVFQTVVTALSGFPGQDEMDAEADSVCTAAFESAVGVSYDRSPLHINLLSPTIVSWLDGDREITCSAGEFGEKTTGPLTEVRVWPEAGIIASILRDECDSEQWTSCDLLYSISPLDSPDEQFAETCGDRIPLGGAPCVFELGTGPPSSEELRSGCADGDFVACDLLWTYSGEGSADERYAASCGERLESEFFCVTEFGFGFDSGFGPGDGVSVLALEVGDCFNDQEDPTATSVLSVPVVDCSLPHDNEIYYEYSMTDATYPGDDNIFDVTGLRCLEEFNRFVGLDFYDSELDLFPMTPTSESWAVGDRAVSCVLYAFDLSKLEGSMEGSRR